VGSALDPAIVRRYIKRNLQKIQYCYEKELRTKPTLAGTVTVVFTIGGDGLVSSATAGGIPEVAPCLTTVIRAIEFPKPAGYVAVDVMYPLTFSSAPS
jgi:hypothetical protein